MAVVSDGTADGGLLCGDKRCVNAVACDYDYFQCLCDGGYTGCLCDMGRYIGLYRKVYDEDIS